MTLRKHFNTKRLILTFAALSILTLHTGCSKAAKDQTQAPASAQGKESLSPSLSPNPSLSHSPSPSLAHNPSPAASDSQQDQDLTKKLTSEQIVQSGHVYLAGNDAVAVIMIKKGTDEKTTKDLATKYAKTMKQKYSNKKINAHAFIEGKEIAHITL